MEIFKYKWGRENWLIYIELKNPAGQSKSVIYSHVIDGMDTDGTVPERRIEIAPEEKYGFVVSRQYIKESAVTVKFDEGLFIRIFRLQDRAYLPSHADLIYTNREVYV